MADLDPLAPVSRRFYYCGPPSRGPLRLLRDWAGAPTGLPDWPQFRDRHVVPTRQGRSAIALLAELWQLGPADEILLPAYNCGTEVDPFVKCGARLVLYRTDERARIDVENLISQAGPRARVVYVTHYFGWPQDLARLTRWCRERGIKLVEDCALALFSATSDRPLGMAGDAAIFSFPKSLPVPDGGALSLSRSSGPVEARIEPPAISRTLRNALPLVKRHVLRSLNALPRLGTNAGAEGGPAGGSRPDLPESYYCKPGSARHGMSALTRGTIARLNRDEITSRRRHNYQRLELLVRDLPGLRLLYDRLPDFVCPLGLPVMVNRRDQWIANLLVMGIDVSAWWQGHHRDLDWAAFPEACSLKDQLVLLPIHHQLSDEHIEYIGQATRSIALRTLPRA